MFQVPPSRQDYSSHPAYRAFLGSVKSKVTKDTYALYLNKYYLSRPENRNLNLTQILSKTPKEIEYEIIAIIEEMKGEANLSYSSINLFIVAVSHFFEINDIPLNKKKINRFKGENVSKFEYRAYTTDEISQLLTVCSERDRAAVLLMASTGMRVGALPSIKLKHLRKWTVERSSYHVYQITVYADSPRSKYYTFCTPEAAKAIDDYLSLRQRYGDSTEDPNTYLFIHVFDKAVIDRRPIKPKVFGQHIISKMVKAGLRKTTTIHELSPQYGSSNVELTNHSIVARHKNDIHPCHSLRIFAVTNMQRAKVDKTIREMLVGHSTGLDKSYYKPQDSEILEEYLKAVDLLTINNENRLQRQVEYYKNRADVVDALAAKITQLEDKLGF